QIELFRLDFACPLLTARGNGRRVTASFEDLGDGFGVVALVVNDEHAQLLFGDVGGGFLGLHRFCQSPQWRKSRPQGPAILPGRSRLDTRPAQPSGVPAVKIGRGGTPVKFGQLSHRWKFRVNRRPSGANNMSDTRALLNRVAEFRKRLEE